MQVDSYMRRYPIGRIPTHWLLPQILLREMCIRDRTGSDAVRMYDLSSGSFDNQIVVCPDKIYGGLENSGQNTEGTGEMCIRDSFIPFEIHFRY